MKSDTLVELSKRMDAMRDRRDRRKGRPATPALTSPAIDAAVELMRDRLDPYRCDAPDCGCHVGVVTPTGSPANAQT